MTGLIFKNNIVSKIGHYMLNTKAKSKAMMAGVAICSYKATKCTDVTVMNNIVAGATYAGFTAPGHPCG